jgi:RNA polymerase sigma-70 factor, ECF subfamily
MPRLVSNKSVALNKSDFFGLSRDEPTVPTQTSVLTTFWSPLRAESETDAQLLALAQRGDRAAFDRLRNRHEAVVRRWIFYRVGQAPLDDVLQDVWLACWQSLPRYAGRALFTTWLHRIVSNKCADYRRRAPIGEISQEDLIDEPLCEESAYSQIELRDVLRDLMVDLNESQREVIELYYGGGLTLQEIANALERNLSTVKQQFYRGHERVTRRLKNSEGQSL